MLREQAYKVVQGHAMRCWEQDGDFRATVESDKEILSCLSLAKIEEAFSTARQLENVDRIFARVFA